MVMPAQSSRCSVARKIFGTVWAVSFGSNASSDCTLNYNIGKVDRPEKNMGTFFIFTV